MVELLRNCRQLVYGLGIFLAAVAVALIANYLLFKFLLRVSKRSPNLPYGTFSKHCRKPALWAMLVVAIHFVLPVIPMPVSLRRILTQLISLTLIATVSWLIIRITYVFDDFIVARFDVGEKDNIRARKIHTQLRVVKRIVIVIVVVIAVSTMLMTFERVRQLGTTILASAGLVGLIVGLAAQRTIGTFIAGLQIAFRAYPNNPEQRNVIMAQTK